MNKKENCQCLPGSPDECIVCYYNRIKSEGRTVRSIDIEPESNISESYKMMPFVLIMLFLSIIIIFSATII